MKRIQTLLSALVLLLVVAVFLPVHLLQSHEGMYPVSELASLGLMEKGLEITPDEIFNPDGDCLVDGICRVNGCTGSFVSEDGLIITNHHCAYRAIQSASSTENDLLKNGFSAADRGTEIPSPGYTVRITESYKDVSDEVLAAVVETMTPSERTKAIEIRQKEIEKKAEAANPAIRAEVAEMFEGKTYVLFEYTFIRDVRLVFAPPSSVGAFGGDVDNWEWPRHTGDFSFMRAYVAPDGSSAEYSTDNVPYKPKKFIQVEPNGVGEGDFVFLLGYPGRTARHKTSAFLKYEEETRLPFIVDLYQWQINLMEEMGKNDRAVALKHSSRSKSLANVEKRSRGQLKGLRRAQIRAGRAAKEAELQSFIDADPVLKEKYGTVLAEIAQGYEELEKTAEYELTFSNLPNACRAMSFAWTIFDSVNERQKADLERESAFMDRNYDRTVQRLLLSIQDWDSATDQKILVGMIDRLSEIPQAQQLGSLGPLLAMKGDQKEIEAMFEKSQIGDPEFVKKCLAMPIAELVNVQDPFLQVIARNYPEFIRLRELGKQRSGRMDRLYGSLIEVKQQFLKTSFVPDANATLRMTFGRVEGYSPEDAVIKTPITSLGGVIDKTTGVEPFVTPDKVQEMYAAREFGSFATPFKQPDGTTRDDIPVAILYSTDTTGGNSGSPILNAKGHLVGVNFDRAFEATINDFAWNQSYSRSIGVDIRYALWITGKVYQANHLLSEMGIDQQ